MREAVFSPDRKYRYYLSDVWEPDGHLLNFVMLNPSTADEVKNDPTVERCSRRAKRLGFSGVIITNLFAWRSTDPRQLYIDTWDKVGADNDLHTIEAAVKASMVICGWGKDGKLLDRGKRIRQALLDCGVTPHYLKLSASSGQPWHPLYVGYDVEPKVWD